MIGFVGSGRTIVAIVIVAGALIGRSDSVAEVSGSMVRVELSKASQPNEFYPLLPVFLKMKVTDDLDTSVTIPVEYAPPIVGGVPGRGIIGVFAGMGTSGPLKQRLPGGKSLSRHSPPPDTVLSPQSIYVNDLVLGYEPGDLKERPSGVWDVVLHRQRGVELAMFAKPGLYRVKVSMKVRLWREAGETQLLRVESNELTLRIVEPQGQDKEAYDILMASKRPWCFSHPAAFSPGPGGPHQEIYKRLTDSVYYPYAKFLRAKEICWSMHELPKGVSTLPPGLPPPDPLRGFELLKELAQDARFPCSDVATAVLEKRSGYIRKIWLRELRKANGTTTDTVELTREKAALALGYQQFAQEQLKGLLPPELAARFNSVEAAARESLRVLKDKYQMDVWP